VFFYPFPVHSAAELRAPHRPVFRLLSDHEPLVSDRLSVSFLFVENAPMTSNDLRPIFFLLFWCPFDKTNCFLATAPAEAFITSSFFFCFPGLDR